MKKTVSFILVSVLILSCLSFAGTDYSPSGFVASAQDFMTESGVQVTIEPILYKSNAHIMQFPARGDYSKKITSTQGDYTISKEINNLGYTFTFPAGTTCLSGRVSLTGDGDWCGFEINVDQHPNYWLKDNDGNIDYTQPVTFRRVEEIAEQDEYGLLYREHLYEKGVEGFKDYSKIYWKLEYICNDEVYTDYFDIPLVDYNKSDRVTLKVLNFNVAGLPSVGRIMGMPYANVPANQERIAEFISENNYDIVAVQEDFNYHEDLVDGLNGYNHMTNHTGSIPGGDGLNIFTNSMPIYNETRVAWNVAHGIIANGADELTPKGFVYSVIDIGNGIYVDFYNLHADAFADEGSIKAREEQFQQLADFICEKSEKNNRPVIITGDFNVYMHRHIDNGGLYEKFYTRCGLKDAWMEIHNGGDYFNLGKWFATEIPAWGHWDSVERFMYKGSDGVGVIATDFNFIEVTSENGKAVSDHSAAECEFVFIKTDEFTENMQQLEIIQASEKSFMEKLMWYIKDLKNIIEHIDELFTYIFEMNAD